MKYWTKRITGLEEVENTNCQYNLRSMKTSSLIQHTHAPTHKQTTLQNTWLTAKNKFNSGLNITYIPNRRRRIKYTYYIHYIKHNNKLGKYRCIYSIQLNTSLSLNIHCSPTVKCTLGWTAQLSASNQLSACL